MECLRLRVKDVDFGYGQILVRDGKGAKDGVTMLPAVFPSRKLSVDPRSGAMRRHHLDEDVLQRAVKEAARTADVHKPVSCHAFRHYLPSLTMSCKGPITQCLVRPA